MYRGKYSNLKILGNLILATLIVLMFACEHDFADPIIIKPPVDTTHTDTNHTDTTHKDTTIIDTTHTDTTHTDTTNNNLPKIIDTTYISNGKIVRIIEGQSYVNNSYSWNGVEIAHSQPTDLKFRNNIIISENTSNYMLNAGDEISSSRNNMLDGAIITGNKFIWFGDIHNTQTITHGLFTGHQSNMIIEYNYLDNVPMSIIRKSTNNMGNVTGGVAYNIVKGGKVAVNVKGMSDVNIFNNTFYSNLTPAENWRGIVYVYKNTDNGYNSVAHNTKIFNNIFYSVYGSVTLKFDSTDDLVGLQSDYNIFWYESGSPVFVVGNKAYSLVEWQNLGYDKNSKIINPKFKDFVNFVPENKLEYGKNLGNEWKIGLSVDNEWILGIYPLTKEQGSVWQVGALIY